MENENQFNQLDRKPHAYLEFGGPGHENEYVFKIQPNKYSEAQEAPSDWEGKLVEILGEGWSVMDRVGRIEIIPPNSRRTEETDLQVRQAIQLLLDEDYIFPETK